MDHFVCRAITLYSYHIPITESCLEPQYSTIGFFDGMYTEKLEIRYEQDDLKELWHYTTKQTGKCDGSYSFQNIFVLADDAWNTKCTDQRFWSEVTDFEYPLTMVVCLQLKEYSREHQGIRRQCEMFNSIVDLNLKNGLGYTYCSIDKNEFIVCLKCKNYHEAVKTIQALHTIHNNVVVYSYSVFSVNHKVLARLSENMYPYLYHEEIESICFKGITNSIKDKELDMRLDEKYYDFCERLAQKLYLDEDRTVAEGDDKGNIENRNKDRIYDILGDDDFRYIARKVKLGKLLYEYRREGMLSYSNKQFAFYLFSSSLVLNTQTESSGENILEESKAYEAGGRLIESWIPECCNAVTKDLEEINDIIQKNYTRDDKILSIYYALYQLLQSFKVLELSPAKRYDFFSMFPPFKMLVEIIRDKLKEQGGRKLVEKNEMFEFIHKISMTFHSAQRTDIQFFQIQDFNVIVHYAPAKLRAFYAFWVLELAELYKMFKAKCDKEYSFIFAPGMFGVKMLRQLYFGGKETKRLMLITLPDRSVYQIKNLLIVLSHETAHVGCERQRERRHEFALKVCAQAAVLELHAFMLCEIKSMGAQLDPEVFIGNIRKDTRMLRELRKVLEKENEIILDSYAPKDAESTIRDDECRRERSMIHIDEAFVAMLENYGDKIIADYCSQIKNTYILSKKGGKNDSEYLTCLGRLCNDAQTEMLELIKMFRNIQLKKILEIFYHIEEEAFSDLITILTMEHSLKDYVSSFTSDEMTKEDLAGNKETTAVIVRMALVIKTVEKVARHKWVRKNRPNFSKEWRGRNLLKLCKRSARHSMEERVCAKILCYMKSVKNSLKQIDLYERMYDVKEHGYTKTAYGILTDQVVWQALYDYLYESAEVYIDTLIKNRDVSNKRQMIIDVYKNLKDGSFIDAVQIIEDFLRYNSHPR